MTTPSASLPFVASLAVDRRTLVVTGSERISWLNGLVTTDLKKLDERQGAYGLVVGKNGRIQADIAVVKAGEELLLSVPASRTERLLELFDKYLVMEDAEISEAPGKVFFQVVGPGADRYGGEAKSAVRLDWWGGEGAAVVCAEEDLAATTAELEARGARIIDDETSALWCARLGVPRFGVDFDETTYPQEASLEKRAVSFTKGCYLGQEVVHTLEVRGKAARRLVPVIIDAGESLFGVDLHADGEPAGRVTSALFDPLEGKAVGLALAKVSALAAGKTLTAGGFTVRLRTAGS